MEASGRPKYPGAYMLTEEEISFLAEMLHEIGVLKEVDYTEYSCWQSCMFEITMKGGEHTVFSSNGGMVIIDEVGYITDKDSWHAEFEIGIFYESCVEKIGAAMGLAS